jgi:squamous cell carcinoma antigen recognized by T-cells 3
LISEPETGLGRKADARNRSLRIPDLPDNTEEGLLQQAVEKLAPVNRLEVFSVRHEAVVEFQSAADAARLLLLPDPLEFNGARLRFSEGEDAPAKAHKAPAVAGGILIPRSAASRPRAGLGRARNPAATTATAAPAAAETASQTSSGGKEPTQGKAQDDFRKMLLGGK